MTPQTRRPSRRSAAWAIGSRPDIFSSARLRLTAFYVLLLAIVIAVFSTAVYVSLVRNIRDGVEEELGDPTAQMRFISRTTADLRLTLGIIDGAVLLVSGVLGYALAGRTLRPIRKSLEDQRSFSSQASHELRTPLTVIKTESELALRETDASPDELRRVLRSTVDEVGRMSAIVADLLALSRGEDAEADRDARPIDLAVAAADVCRRLRPLWEAKGIIVSCEASAGAFVSAARAPMEKVLTNLVQNAINYTPRGGSVSVRVLRQDGQVTVTVADTGVGIAKDDLPHVFEAFYKGRHVGTDVAQGSGLGLAIVKQAVADFGGKIVVASEVGKGTTMTASFPPASSSLH